MIKHVIRSVISKSFLLFSSFQLSIARFYYSFLVKSISVLVYSHAFGSSYIIHRVNSFVFISSKPESEFMRITLLNDYMLTLLFQRIRSFSVRFILTTHTLAYIIYDVI